MRNTLRKHRALDICTDWLLLRKLSRKQFVESLQNAGLNSKSIAQYQLAWQCFKHIYAPTQTSRHQALSRPSNEIWDAIAQLYNKERLSQLTFVTPACQPATIEEWLLTIARQARLYLYPPLDSLNKPKQGSESGELQDELTSEPSQSLLDEMILKDTIEARQGQQTQINDLLASTLSALKPESQTLLKLYYANGLTQDKIAQHQNLKQYTVSRRLSKSREKLLTALVQWSQETMEISLDSGTINQMGTLLEEWLNTHYEFSTSPKLHNVHKA